jgi:TRAP-type mannitol/chloroaromatic compound transport system permease large subunit
MLGSLVGLVVFFIGWFVSYLDLNFIAVELLKGKKLLLFFPSVLIPGKYPLWPLMKAEAQ